MIMMDEIDTEKDFNATTLYSANVTEVSATEAEKIKAEMSLFESKKCDHNEYKVPASRPYYLWKSEGGHLEYSHKIIPNNKISQDRIEKTRRLSIHGTEVRDLGADHFLCGEQGLFATKRFRRFDILGEYTGYIVDEDVGGSYVATLENDHSTFKSLGVNAATCGNELRFINGYQNIEFAPNLEMKTVYIDTYPHVILVCVQDVEVGDEFLLDYGSCYVNEYMSGSPAPATCTATVTADSDPHESVA